MSFIRQEILVYLILIFFTPDSTRVSYFVYGSAIHEPRCANLTNGRFCTRTWTIPRPRNKSYSCENVQDKLDCTFMDSITMTKFIENTYCMTIDESNNVTYVGKCPSGRHQFTRINRRYFTQLPYEVKHLNKFMCNSSMDQNLSHYQVCNYQNRKGLLCSQCHDGFGPTVLSYTYECKKCYWYGWLLYGIYAFFPATVLCLLIIILRIDATEPYMNTLVLSCHVVINIVNSHPCSFFQYANDSKLLYPALSIVTIYGLFNMDFFSYLLPSFCVSNKMSILHVKLLDYIIAIYPLCFIALIYVLVELHDNGCRLLVWMWRPFHRCLVQCRRSWNIKGSLINAFATLYLLSFTKVASVSYSLLVTTDLADICGQYYRAYLYYDPSCKKLTKCHFLYATCAFTVLSIFVIVPTLYLFLHPFKIMQRFASLLKLKSLLLNEITKVCCKSYKDHTDAKIDCRWFASVYLALRIAIVFTQMAIYSYVWQVFVVCLAIMLVAAFRPYHKEFFNRMDLIVLSLMAVSIVTIHKINLHYEILLYFLPFIGMLILTCYKILLLPFSLQIKQKCLTVFNRIVKWSTQNTILQRNECNLQSEQSSLIQAGVSTN